MAAPGDEGAQHRLPGLLQDGAARKDMQKKLCNRPVIPAQRLLRGSLRDIWAFLQSSPYHLFFHPYSE